MIYCVGYTREICDISVTSTNTLYLLTLGLGKVDYNLFYNWTKQQYGVLNRTKLPFPIDIYSNQWTLYFTKI